MTLTRRTSLLLLLLCTLACSAQKRNNVWAFGDSLGLDFNTDPVSAIKTRSSIVEAPYFLSSICDTSGMLWFYSDGLRIWNTNNVRLPKHGNFWPWDGHVMPLFVPYPDNDSLFYLFGVADDGDRPWRLQGITVRAFGSWYTGDVIYPRPADALSYITIFSEDVSLLLAGTGHCNGKDTWLVTHSPGALNAYHISASGINTNPVVSAVAANILSLQKIKGGNSNMKFSANGERMVIPLISEGKVAVFKFNNLTGRFTDPIILSVPKDHRLEDVELSPDGTKLYFASYYIVDFDTGAELHCVFQLDLEAGSPAQVQQSVYQVNGYGDRVVCFRTCIELHRTMQLGPDGRIYVSMREGVNIALDKTVSVIEEPNKKGGDARYSWNIVNLKKVNHFLSYNYVRSGSFPIREKGITVQKSNCSDEPVKFGLLFNDVDSVKWNFGDPASGNENFSFAIAPGHQYLHPGSYTVKAIIFKKCISDTAVHKVNIITDKAVHVPDFIRDSVGCSGDELVFNATTTDAKVYLWENGLSNAQRVITTPGHYTLSVYNDCSFDHREFDVQFENCPCSVFIPTAFTPDGDGLNDLFKPVTQCYARAYQFRIYNRYGGLVFESGQLSQGWNGKQHQKELPTGVYVWTLQYENPNNKELVSKKGTVLLMR